MFWEPEPTLWRDPKHVAPLRLLVFIYRFAFCLKDVRVGRIIPDESVGPKFISEGGMVAVPVPMAKLRLGRVVEQGKV
jgi:hypothetical protein